MSIGSSNTDYQPPAQAGSAWANRLAHQTSPYLRQHAHNPVDWYPWGEEAFEAARRRNCPIFLSIGYSTCYWCHVMERQVFENPQLAALMNDLFVNVKVDREERPDIDELYMTALQIMTGRGGWPMSLFLIPPLENPQTNSGGLVPFYAGAYFPPTATGGMPGFDQVLRAVADAWRGRHSEVLAQARQLAQAVREHLEQPTPATDVALNTAMVQHAVTTLLRSYDHVDGGFGGAPKFPQPSSLLFLARVYEENRDEDLRHTVTHTLDRMARGGIYDQIAGGFHRYSVDAQWLVPHFEKMLYDNGQLLELYALAHQAIPPADDPDFFARIVRQSADDLLRTMRDGSGAFWSAQDAEVAGREGDSYLWTPDEVRAAVADDSLAARALILYGLDRGPNFHDPHHPDALPSNVLHLPRQLSELAQDWHISLPQVVSLKAQIDRRLLAARDRRPQPRTDDKVLASWNGLAMAGLAVAARVLREPPYADAASRAATAVLHHMTGDDGSLFHTMRDRKAGVPGFLEDYAHLSHGLLELHRTTGSPSWLHEASRLTDLAIHRFQGFDTLPRQHDLFARPRSRLDGALPSPTSQLLHNLLDLHELTGDNRWALAAGQTLRELAGDLQQHATAMAHTAHALLRALRSVPASLCPDAVEPPSPTADGIVSVRIVPQPVPVKSGCARFAVNVHIAPGYHIYAHDPADGVLPTELTLTDLPGAQLEVAYPRGYVLNGTSAGQPVHIYEGRVTLHVAITLSPSPAICAITRSLRCQPCTQRLCLPPIQMRIAVSLTS